MKVLQILGKDFPDGGYGGVISLYRLHSGLRAAGIDSRLMANKRMLSSSAAIPRSPKLERVLGSVTRRVGLNDVHCVGSFKIKKTSAYEEADVLNFHGIHGDFFSYLALPSLTANKATVFTVRDAWPLTGHCAVTYDCERWKTGCGKCPYPDAPPALPAKRDATHLEWKLKNWAYRHSRLTVVTLNRKMMDHVKQSMLGRFPIHHIPNGVDTNAYQRLDPDLCRSVLGIPRRKKALLFVAGHLTRRHKGADLLAQALERVPASLKSELVLLLVGEGGNIIADSFGLQVLPLGYVSGHRLKAMAYSAADLLVSPTRADGGLPNVMLESMACGTPIVSFDVGGIADLVRPSVSGYLARAEDVQDFSNGIVHLLENGSLRHEMGEQCRTIVVREYSAQLEVQRYIALYDDVLHNRESRAA
jgi:glycosyltransferase involved in cell wall biosynthesis